MTKDNRQFTQKGFTLMEIVVATTIFAVVATAMMSLFNYTLKINRRTEAIRQATQGMRTFVEGMVKQIRNGQIYYGVTHSSPQTMATDNSSVCGPGSVANSYYLDKENRIRILDTDGVDTCVYLADAAQNYVGTGVYSGSNLVIEKLVKNVYVKQTLNPPNFYIDNLAFIIRPVCDPYNNCNNAAPNVYASNLPPRIQPEASVFMKIRVKLPTGEQVQLYYQTSVSSNKYDIPNG